MSGLNRRAAHLERRTPPRRCEVCRDWSACRVADTNPEMAALGARWAKEWQLPAGLPGPDRCPSCGWEPLTIRIRYVDMERPL